MMRFSPGVSCSTQEEQAEGDFIFLDITGCERIFGGFDRLVGQVSDSLSRLGVRAHVAVAPTPGAAWALAYSGRDRAIVEEHQLESALAPLPPEALRVGDEIAATLRHLGLCTIGQVMHLPRKVLPARFGPAILRRVDQAMGRIAEPLAPLEYCPPVEARLDWDGSVGSLEAIWSIFQQLIGQLIEQLTRRGQGARRLDVQLLRAYAPPVQKTIFLSRPSRDPVNWFNLFRCAIEPLQLPLHQPRSRVPLSPRPPVPLSSVSPSSICDDGFCGMRVAVPLCERMTDEQISLIGHEQYAGQAELEHLIERLRVRLGEPAIVRPELIESHLPENAWENSKCEMRNSNQIRTTNERSIRQSNFELRHSPRPLQLLPCPVEIRVMVTPSESAEGVPAAFAHEGQMCRVAHAVGPERIAGRWWDGHDKTRDYFDVASPDGRRFWIFRVRQTGRWYLHGNFE